VPLPGESALPQPCIEGPTIAGCSKLSGGANARDSSILIVDDDAANNSFVEQLLIWAGYANVRSVTDAAEGLELAREACPDLILLDLSMPDIDGYEFMRRLGESSPRSSVAPVLVFTGDISPEAKTKALELGASDFLTKPGDSTEILLRVKNFLRLRQMQKALEKQNRELERRVRERTAALESARREVLERLAIASEYRDDETGEHTRRVGELSAKVARGFGLNDENVDLIRSAAPLHDVGKIGIPDSILKKPGKLTAEEFEIVKTHTEIGARILSGGQTAVMQLAESIALSHHERWDGTGYPYGLVGEQIPICGRIVAVADVFDALTSERVYKSAIPPAEAVEIILAESGKHFDPQVVDAFLSAIRELETERSRVAA